MQIKPLVIGSIFAAVGGMAQAEAVKIGENGGWEIYRDSSMGNGCYMTGSYEDNSLLMLGFDLSVDKAFVSVFSPDFGDLEDGASYPMDISLNGEAYEAEAVGLDGEETGDGMLIFVESEDFLVDLAQGKSLVLSQEGTEFVKLDLTQSSAAVLATLNCVTGE